MRKTQGGWDDEVIFGAVVLIGFGLVALLGLGLLGWLVWVVTRVVLHYT